MRRVGLLIVATLASCGPRAPGPAPEEVGLVAFWEVVEAELAFDACTDATLVREVYPEPREWVGTFLTYRLETGAETATGMECTATERDACAPARPPRIYDVHGSTLTSTAGEALRTFILGPDGLVPNPCVATRDDTWRLQDEGETLRITTTSVYQLTGQPDDCLSLDADYIVLGSNGVGLRDCVVTLEARARLFGFR